MDPSKISAFIKEVRTKSNLTQEKFADKYGVTYQAVSKWENGKNMPDISILKKICDDYNTSINDLLDGNNKASNNKKIYVIAGIVLAIVVIILVVLGITKKENFEMKKITANCDNFKLYGSIAYNSSKTSVQISNITYCGKKDENKYNKIECILYEYVNDTKKEVKSFTYNNERPILLNEYLENIDFTIDHYSKTCNMYKDGVLNLEIKATNDEGTVYYDVPLKMEDC
ncbi:MAG: helix-turn-helix transcriptional regulator [Bacilli bacterium]|nr:helix-turn-helix transcriptional regulator [Bacilli bacterium]